MRLSMKPLPSVIEVSCFWSSNIPDNLPDFPDFLFFGLNEPSQFKFNFVRGQAVTLVNYHIWV